MFSVGCAVQCRHGERTWGVSRGSAQECGTCGVRESRGLLYQRPKVPTLPPSWPALAGCGGQRMSRLSAAGIRHSRSQNGSGDVGEIRLDVRLPPIGEPIVSLLSSWARKTCERHTNGLRNERSGPCRRVGGAPIGRRPDLKQRGLASCRKPAALSGLPLYRDRLLAAFPVGLHLTGRSTVDWDALSDEDILVQGWDESQTARELHASFLGDGARLRSHAASKQSVFALLGAGFGVTLATASQSEVVFPGVVFKRVGACIVRRL
jgi:hypothetical protein